MVGVTKRVAVFRPDDNRLREAVTLLESLGVEPLADPMLAIESTGEQPREDARYTIFTSKTGVELASEAGWTPTGEVCAIGSSTAAALRDQGYTVNVVPEQFSSAGLVAALESRVDGARVEVARSDHGSDVLTDGLEDAGAYLHETILYRLIRPPDSGVSCEAAARRDLDGACFTSSLTVEHFLEAAAERELREAAVAGLNDAIVGCIGDPTRETAVAAGVEVDVVPDRAAFEALARAVVGRLSAVNR